MAAKNIKKEPNYLLARFDYWIREAFENEQSTLYRVVNDIIVLLIFFSIGSIVAASMEEFYTAHQSFFDISEMIVVGLFTLEYFANIYVAKEKSKYIFGPWGIIDFLAIAPSYLNIGDFRAIKVLRVLRILRFLRLMRMLKLIKQAKHIASGGKADEKVSKFDTLKMDLQIYFIALFSVLVIFSTLEYFAERGIEGTAFTSIPKAMWWCIVTITTVGYGDMYPTGVLGRIIAGAAMLCGVALFGLLMNVIGKYMMTELFGSSIGEEIDIKELEENVAASKGQKK
jgi:voltage-gated potassium channel Kch